MTGSVVRAVHNPASPEQVMVLWGTGRLDAFGAPQPDLDTALWLRRLDQPVAVGLHVTSWTTPAGYVLDRQGGMHSFGGAPDLAGKPPYFDSRVYVDLNMNPANNGQGYALERTGKVVAFGGAPAATGWPTFGTPIARRLHIDWGHVARRGYVLTVHGSIHAFSGAVAAGAHKLWPGFDIIRDLFVVDWNTGTGYQLDAWGGVHPVGGVPAVYGGPYWRGLDNARAIFRTATNPQKFLLVDVMGHLHGWVSSTAPTVVVTEPAAEVTTTTRPTILWTYTDAQRDSQAAWEVRVFRNSDIGAGFSPTSAAATSAALLIATGTDPNRRGLAPTVDLPSVAVTAYVRARDTSGRWSDWASRSWTQNVAAPAAPTLTAQANASQLTVALTATFAVAPVAGQRVRFEYLEAGTWLPVRGADAVTPSGTTATATDREAPIGSARSYRARQYQPDPLLSGTASSTVNATLTVAPGMYLVDLDQAAGAAVRLPNVSGLRWAWPVRGDVFEADGREDPIVVSSTRPTYRRAQLDLTTVSRAQASSVLALLTHGGTLLWRDHFGDLAYLRPAPGAFTADHIGQAAPASGDPGPVGYVHRRTVDLIEVRRPPVLTVALADALLVT